MFIQSFRAAIASLRVLKLPISSALSKYIEYPLTINGINNESIDTNSLSGKCGDLCEVRPCGEKYNNKTYIADFVIDFSKKDKDGHFVYPKISDVKYVIELDGFEYHSNKQQMANDYEREQSIMELGYKIIRFTGSQIYNSPEDCVKKTISIIYKDIIKQITKGEHICRS